MQKYRQLHDFFVGKMFISIVTDTFLDTKDEHNGMFILLEGTNSF